jgi:hypothetical protein
MTVAPAASGNCARQQPRATREYVVVVRVHSRGHAASITGTQDKSAAIADGWGPQWSPPGTATRIPTVCGGQQWWLVIVIVE